MASPAEAWPQGSNELVFDPSQPLAVIGYVELDGLRRPVYDTNNLYAWFGGYVDALDGVAGDNPYDYQRMFESQDSKAREIAEKFQASHSETFEAAAGLWRELREAKHRVYSSGGTMADYRLITPTREQRFARDVLFSQMYEEIAPIATDVNPDLNPRDLCA